MKKLVIVDGNSLLFRAYYATSFTGTIMRRKDGFPTNAIFGFSNMMNKIISTLKDGDLLFVSFDTGKKTFRHKEMETYKAQRKPIDEDLKLQLPVARDLLKAMGVFYYELEGYEGDDLAGTVAKIGSNANLEVDVYTSDKDYLQLINDNISIYMITKGIKEIKIMNKESLFNDMGLTPDQIRDYKGLMGDPSDNIKGIPGVGEKTAIKLLQQYSSLEGIIEAMKNEKSKLAQKILDNQDLGKFCKHIATIDTEVPLPFTLDDLEYSGYDFNELSSFYTKQEFYSLLKKLKPNSKKRNINKTSTEKSIKFEKILISSFKDLPNNISTFVLDYNQTNYHHANINNVIFADDKNVYIYDYSLAKKDKDFINFITNEEIKKATFDSKAMYVLLNKDHIQLNGITFDLLLASYLLDSSLANDPITVCAYFGENILSNDQVTLFDDNSSTCNLTFVINSIKNDVITSLKEIDCYDLYNNIELKLAIVLAKMEIEGFPLNKEALNVINEKYNVILNELTEKIDILAGVKINLASPKQVADLLFNKLMLPSNKKQSTSIEVLNSIKHLHPIVPLLIEYRKYSKLISTYTSGLSDYIFPDGKIHALFNQALTTTGRLSSSEPNLQNISVRDEEGKLIRKAFFYDDEDLYLLSLDYSQIELRLLAHMANVSLLIKAFNEGKDVHEQTAREIFNIPNDEEVPSNLRRKAKTVNFGIVYGISDWGLAEQLSCPVQEAKTIINNFYLVYPEIKTYFDNVVEFATKNNYVTTLFKRRRYILELNSDNYQTREFGKRAAQNAPIQGTAADLIKMAMIKIDEEITNKKLKSKLVLQIHDELIFKIYPEEKDIMYNLVKNTMESIYPLNVKLEVDGACAKTWYDCK